jgi:uncharacterized protein YecE (DUF72 family)
LSPPSSSSSSPVPSSGSSSNAGVFRLRAGTSGYAYKEWKGAFYPEKIKPAEMLAFYAGRLATVEINNTFYRMPKKSVLESWAAQVPGDFRFSIKASRRITHFKRLKETDEETAFLVGNVAVLGDRLGVVLFQLPPNLRCDLERLDRFLALLPEGLPAAFEFRHESWRDGAVHERLHARDFAVVTVDGLDGGDEEGDEAGGADPSGSTAARPEFVAGATWGYLRLRRPDYDRAALADWALDIARMGWREAFVYFKHEDEAAGPRMAADFLVVAAESAASTRAPRRAPVRPRDRQQETG